MGKSLMMKIMATVCALFLCTGAAGVYAAWIYPSPDLEEHPENVQMQMGEFIWDAEEVLPGEEEDANHENHIAFLETLLNGTYTTKNWWGQTKTYDVGLNGSDYLMPELEGRLEGKWLLNVPSRDTLGSMAVTQGDTLEDCFKADASHNLSYVIQIIDVNGDKKINGSDGDYFYFFTFNSDLLSLESEIDPWVRGAWLYPIYRSTIGWTTGEYITVEGVTRWAENEWIVKGSSGAGSARAEYYEESQNENNKYKSTLESIDPDTWVPGDRRSEN